MYLLLLLEYINLVIHNYLNKRKVYFNLNTILPTSFIWNELLYVIKNLALTLFNSGVKPNERFQISLIGSALWILFNYLLLFVLYKS